LNTEGVRCIFLSNQEALVQKLLLEDRGKSRLILDSFGRWLSLNRDIDLLGKVGMAPAVVSIDEETKGP